MIVFGQGRKTPIDIARARDFPVARTGDSYYVRRAVLKFRFGSVLLWEQAAKETGRPDMFVSLFTLQVDLIMRRMTSIKLTEAERILGRGVPSLCCRLGIARRDTVWLTFLDVEKSVHESLKRREVGLRQLPATRSRDLMAKLSRQYLAARGTSLEPNAEDQATVDVLRARATDREILRRWQMAMFSRLPRVKTITDLSKHWNAFQGDP